jgi:hypothetical protein
VRGEWWNSIGDTGDRIQGSQGKEDRPGVLWSLVEGGGASQAARASLCRPSSVERASVAQRMATSISLIQASLAEIRRVSSRAR